MQWPNGTKHTLIQFCAPVNVKRLQKTFSSSIICAISDMPLVKWPLNIASKPLPRNRDQSFNLPIFNMLIIIEQNNININHATSYENCSLSFWKPLHFKSSEKFVKRQLKKHLLLFFHRNRFQISEQWWIWILWNNFIWKVCIIIFIFDAHDFRIECFRC